MSVEAILTLVTVALAVMALIPQERAQDLQVRLGGFTRIVTILGSLLVLYWTFLEQVHALPGVKHLPRPLKWYGGWQPASLSLLVFLLVAGVGYWSYRRRLPVHRLPRLTRAIADALARRRYGECIHLLETHLATIEKAHRGSYWQARLRRRIAPTAAELFQRARVVPRTPAIHEENASASPRDGAGNVAFALELLRERLRSQRAPEYGPLARRYAVWAEKPGEAAQDLVRLISLAPALVTEIASANPYLGLRILRVASTWLNREFASDFARALLTDPDSAFYRELRRAETIDSDGVIAIDPKEQPMLAALCADASRPDGAELLYTFLDAGIEPLRAGHGDALRAVLNGMIGDFHERGRWTSPPFATVYLLEIVGPRVAVDPRATLPNLYVAHTLVAELLRQLEPADDVDITREWPTPTHYLLYATVRALRELVRILKARPASLDAVRAAQPRAVEPTTLPEHAIDVLGSVMYECMKSQKLDCRFKSYLLEVWWHVYWEKWQDSWPGSDRVLEAFAKGGNLGGDMRHREGVAEALSGIDWVLQHCEAATSLRRRFGIEDHRIDDIPELSAPR